MVGDCAVQQKNPAAIVSFFALDVSLAVGDDMLKFCHINPIFIAHYVYVDLLMFYKIIY